MVKGEEGLERGLRLLGWEISESKVNQCPVPHSSANQEMEEQERNHPRKQTTGATKEVLLSHREVFQIFQLLFSKETLHVPFLLGKKGGKTCFRDQTLTYKNYIYIHWEYVLQLRSL